MQGRQKNCGGSPSLSHDPNWLPPSLQSFEVLLSYPLGTWANIVWTTTFSVLCFIFFLLSNITCTEVLVSWFLQSSFNDVQFSSQRKLCLIRGSSHIFIGFWICFHERLYKYFPKYQLDKESRCWVRRLRGGAGQQSKVLLEPKFRMEPHLFSVIAKIAL